MNRQNLRLLAEHIAIGLNHHIPQMGIFFILPCGIFAVLPIGCIVESRQLLQLIQQRFFFLIHGAAHGEGQIHGVAQLGNTQVQTGFHQTGNLVAHGLHTIGDGAEQSGHLGCRFGGQGIAAQRIHVKCLNRGVRLIVLLPDLRLQRVGDLIDPLQLNAHSHQCSLAGTRNGIVLGTAGERGQAQRHDSLNPAHEFAHDLVGVGTVFMNLRAGMAALQAIHYQPDAGAVDGFPLRWQGDAGMASTGAGNGEDSLVLGIQIQQHPAIEHGQVNHIRAQHSDFLIHRNYHFQRRMGNGRIIQQRQRVGNGNSVVTAQRGSVGIYILIVVSHIQTFCRHIQCAGRLLLADHVHMALQDHRGMVLHTAGAILKNDYIIRLVLNIS